MTWPFVSCLMPTYNRVPTHTALVEEAIESFFRQEYLADRMELVILNDCAIQTLELPDDEWIVHVASLNPVWVREHVKIHNVKTRTNSLGEKHNQMMELARGDVILPWDDDDISLPQRIAFSVAGLYGLTPKDLLRYGVTDAPPPFGYWNPGGHWFWNETPDGRGNANGAYGLQVPGSIGYCHNCSAFTRRAWAAVGGYPPISYSEDMVMDQRLKACQAFAAAQLRLPPSEWQYVYRWGVSGCHLSGRPNLDRYWHELGHRPATPGDYVLHPHWRRDYTTLTDRLVKRLEAKQQRCGPVARSGVGENP